MQNGTFFVRHKHGIRWELDILSQYSYNIQGVAKQSFPRTRDSP